MLQGCTIVTSTYRCKRPPRKRKAMPLEGPVIVRRGAAKPERHWRQPTMTEAGDRHREEAEEPIRRGARAGHQRRGDAADAMFREIVRRATGMTTRPIPTRHWRSYGTEPLPTGREALEEPFRAFPSWFMRITCDRCGKDRMLNEAHMHGSDVPIRDIITRMRHDGFGGRAGKVELLTGIEGASSRPGRRIAVVDTQF